MIFVKHFSYYLIFYVVFNKKCFVYSGKVMTYVNAIKTSSNLFWHRNLLTFVREIPHVSVNSWFSIVSKSWVHLFYMHLRPSWHFSNFTFSWKLSWWITMYIVVSFIAISDIFFFSNYTKIFKLPYFKFSSKPRKNSKNKVSILDKMNYLQQIFYNICAILQTCWKGSHSSGWAQCQMHKICNVFEEPKVGRKGDLS